MRETSIDDRISYDEFIKSKRKKVEELGFEPNKLNPMLFDFQKHVVFKALKKGRYAIFGDCGLGKTPMCLEIANQCYLKTRKPSLILTPLAVVGQFLQESKKFGYDSISDSFGYNIHVTNYEQIDNIDSSKYGAVCLDESSILKNFQGKLKNKIISVFSGIDYRFCFTATPSPNDVMELGNHSEFLGHMKFKNMLSMYFINDMDTVQKWRLKGHAEDLFWEYVGSWSSCFTSPCDLGFDDKGYILPELNLIDLPIKTDKISNGLLFNQMNVSSTNHNQELKRTFDLRMAKSIEIANSTNKPVIVWAKQNVESEYLSKNIKGAKEVTGSMKDEEKKKLLLGFANGDFRVLVTKPKIAQYGLNYQHCNIQVFPSLDFSFEGTYQAIRRSYRFGQKEKVNIYMITTDTMQNVRKAINDKQKQFKLMQEKLKKYAA